MASNTDDLHTFNCYMIDIKNVKAGHTNVA